MSEEPQKRQRKVRALDEEEESNEFWKNCKYFKSSQEEKIQNEEREEQDDECDEYVPSGSDEEPLDLNEEEDDDDYIDSQEEEDDEEEEFYDPDQSELSNDKIVKQSPENPHLQLFKSNLSEYSFVRGLHHYEVVSQIPRLGKTSYIDYFDKQTYKANPVLNRRFLGLPYTGKSTGYDEQARTKTDFNHMLYELEDKRFHIDMDIIQIRRMLFHLEQGKLLKLLEYEAFRKININPLEDKEKIIEKLQEKLEQTIKEREKLNFKSEPALFRQSLDEDYFLKKQALLMSFTPRFIQEEFIKRVNLIEEVLADNDQQEKIQQLFNVKTPTQDIVNDEWVNQYNTDHSLIPPTYILQFDSRIEPTLELIRQSLKIEKESLDNIFSQDVFEDIALGFFQNKQQEVFNRQIKYLSIEDLLSIQELKQYTVMNRIFQSCQERIRYFLNFQQSSYTETYLKIKSFQLFPLRGKTISLWSTCPRIHQILIQLEISTNNVPVIICGQQYELFDIVIEVILRQFRGDINPGLSQEFYRNLFPDELALQIQATATILCHFKQLLLRYQYDNISVQFLLSWVRKIPGSRLSSQISQITETASQETLIGGIAQQLKTERCGLIRVQQIDSYAIIHSFDIAKSIDHQDEQQNSISEK